MQTHDVVFLRQNGERLTRSALLVLKEIGIVIAPVSTREVKSARTQEKVMFIGNNDYKAPIAHSVDGQNSDAAKLVANGVQAIEREFSLMDREHARIRTEALAAHAHDVREPRSASAIERGPLESSNL